MWKPTVFFIEQKFNYSPGNGWSGGDGEGDGDDDGDAEALIIPEAVTLAVPNVMLLIIS